MTVMLARAARHVAARTLLAVSVWWAYDWTLRAVDRHLYARVHVP